MRAFAQRLDWMVLSVAAMFAAPAAQPAVAVAAPNDLKPEQETRTRPPDPALARVLKKVCAHGTCKGIDGTPLVSVWRDKKEKIRVVLYESMGCYHPTRRYYDARGKFLIEAQSGPREPNEWNSPGDKKIRALMTGLHEAESETCRPFDPRLKD